MSIDPAPHQIIAIHCEVVTIETLNSGSWYKENGINKMKDMITDKLTMSIV